MAVKSNITDGSGSDYLAKVTSRGELVVGQLDFSSAYNATADVAGTGYNLVEPKAGCRFVITAILVYADKDVGVNDATVTIYEASAPDTATVDDTIATFEIPEKTARDWVGLNLIVSEGKWVNIKTDDDDVFATILGYYVSA